MTSERLLPVRPEEVGGAGDRNVEHGQDVDHETKLFVRKEREGQNESGGG